MAERLEIGLVGIFYSRQMLEWGMQNEVLVQVLRGNCYEPERLVLYDAGRRIDATIARPWRVSKARFSFSSCHVDDWKGNSVAFHEAKTTSCCASREAGRRGRSI